MSSCCYLFILFFCFPCNNSTDPLEMFSMQHLRWELLLAAPKFTSLKGFVGFNFSKNTLLFAHFGCGPAHGNSGSISTWRLYKPRLSLDRSSLALSLCSHFVPGFTLVFGALAWLRRLHQQTQVRRFGLHISLYRFTSFFSSLTNMLTKTWQKRLIPAGRRSSCAAAWFALRGWASLRCRWWKWSMWKVVQSGESAYQSTEWQLEVWGCNSAPIVLYL